MRGAPGGRLAHRPDVVMRLIERRPDQIVHRGVDDDEILGLAALQIEHARDEDAGIADDQPARLEDQRAAEPARRALDDRGIGVRIGRRLVVLAIGNAEPAAEIDMLDGVAVGTQRADEFGQQREGVVERLQIGDLAADMHVDAGDLMPGSFGRMRIDLARAADRNAELVLGLAGRDLRVGPGVDVRIDAQRDRARAPLPLAIADSSSSSGSDSTLMQRMPSSTASANSRAVLPMPENMILSAAMPAASARLSSPSDTTSAPAPSRASVAITAWLEFAFMA